LGFSKSWFCEIQVFQIMLLSNPGLVDGIHGLANPVLDLADRNLRFCKTRSGFCRTHSRFGKPIPGFVAGITNLGFIHGHLASPNDPS
jgi:hypothetical protein